MEGKKGGNLDESSGKNKIIAGARSVAEDVMDDLPYKVREYFDGWPEDVVGNEMADIFWKNLYKHLGKLVREKNKKP